MTVELEVDGTVVEVSEVGSLLHVLRDELGLTSVKDGCSPQGQCGCCTVLVDGAPRVACVTPVRRVAGRAVTTLAGLSPHRREQWGAAFLGAGASQCGFCTPGIILRLEGLTRRPRIGGAPAAGDEPAGGVLRHDPGEVAAAAAAEATDRPGSERTAVDRALAAHLCRCTGWQTISEAFHVVRAGDIHAAGGAGQGPRELGAGDADEAGGARRGPRDLAAAAQRAALEGRADQQVSAAVALGAGGFADDAAPPDALVAMLAADGTWVVGETEAEARRAAGTVPGRRTTVASKPPLEIPEGDWQLRLQTSWVDPAYLETDASWCEPGGQPVSPVANGGAFGGKSDSPVAEVARQLASRHGRPVRVRFTREDCMVRAAKRPPLAAGLRSDGSGQVVVVRTPGVAERIAALGGGLEVFDVDVAGPPTSGALRAAGWGEVLVLRAALAHLSDPSATRAPEVEIVTPNGAWATVRIRTGATGTGGAGDVGGVGGARGAGAVGAAQGSGGADVAGGNVAVEVRVCCGVVLDEVVLRSYSIGAVHMGLSWVTSESLAVADDGEVLDRTLRAAGVLPAAAMPAVEVHPQEPASRSPSGAVGPTGACNGSDAVFLAAATAAWIHQTLPPSWPTGIALVGRP
jgi:xanthine dehydrogenase small subunit